ncbi:hypothetical protein F5X97DRAFT_311563 [Nemania serpens]|nr:hypothetical protein F5X97DRAFT_311563 [Nemania serpens]
MVAQQAVFQGINLKGDRCVFGSTAPGGITMRNVKVEGSDRVDGVHTPDTLQRWGRRQR